LSIEPSWANIADKLAYGLLDGAMLLPPLALALGLGVSGGCGLEAILVLAALSLNGNTVTLANAWAAPVLGDDLAISAAETARRFHEIIRERGKKPVLAVVHTFSTHDLLLRYWLAAGGIDPDGDVTLVVVPPAQTPEALAAGVVDGFCAGAPWGEVAARAGIGGTVATSHACSGSTRSGLMAAAVRGRLTPRWQRCRGCAWRSSSGATTRRASSSCIAAG
jgi:two-component system, oxyanion-binding sensor